MMVDAELPAGVPGIDVPRLASWLAETLPGIGRISAIDAIAGGRSNLTYRIGLSGGHGAGERPPQAGGRDAIVLRRPPLGHVQPTAHDMGREYRVVSALADGGQVPVPRPLAFCADTDVIGAQFYLMDYVEGRVLKTVQDAAGVEPEQARQLSERLAEALAGIHLLDYRKAGLGDFGRPEGYMSRQLSRWRRQWDGSSQAILATGARWELPEYDRLVARLEHGLPTAGRSSLVHGDFRLDNALVRLRPRPQIGAVVDWEMSTLGDPMADLGLTMVYWTEPTDEVTPVSSTVTAAPGFLSRREFVERYAALTGFDVGDLDYYVAFGCFKLAVVLAGIHARFMQNATVGEGFDEIGESVPLLIEWAHAVLDAGSPW